MIDHPDRRTRRRLQSEQGGIGGAGDENDCARIGQRTDPGGEGDGQRRVDGEPARHQGGEPDVLGGGGLGEDDRDGRFGVEARVEERQRQESELVGQRDWTRLHDYRDRFEIAPGT